MKRSFSLLLIFSLFLLPACRSALTTLDQGQPSLDTVNIAYGEAPSTYSPLSYEAKNRKFFSNIYEPLVRFDSTFNVESSLAVSWGRLDPNTWDFHLRQGVYFHDGRNFTAEDAVYSLDLARGKKSELSALLSTISGVKKTGEDRFEISTSKPDPLLLNKLTYVYMVPSGITDFSLPLGTGPYRVMSYTNTDLTLERFEDYWGSLAYFPVVELKTILDPDQRLADFESGILQVLANVPPQAVFELEDQGALVETFPSLEESYLILNQSRVFADANLRAAVWYALSSDYAQTLGGGYLQATSQYAATGIEGYSKDAPQRRTDLELAQNYRDKVEGDVAVTLDLPEGLNALGEAIASDLEKIDIFVTVNVLTATDLQAKIQSGRSDLYFFGWKYDLADNADFFEAVVHGPEGSYGAFNGTGYQDSDLDAWIEEAASELSLEGRRSLITRIEERLIEDKGIIPLFESKTLYAFGAPLIWNLRLDGQLWATDLTENVVK